MVFESNFGIRGGDKRCLNCSHRIRKERTTQFNETYKAGYCVLHNRWWVDIEVCDDWEDKYGLI